MLKVGKLYSCSRYFLLIYPDKKTAASAALRSRAAAPASVVAGSASYWSKQFDKPVSYCEPETPLLVLAVEEKYVEVLAGDQKGWIINKDRLNIKEITDDAA
jgi:hypothetical protein